MTADEMGYKVWIEGDTIRMQGVSETAKGSIILPHEAATWIRNLIGRLGQEQELADQLAEAVRKAVPVTSGTARQLAIDVLSAYRALREGQRDGDD